jgi:hypothetical protein
MSKSDTNVARRNVEKDDRKIQIRWITSVSRSPPSGVWCSLQGLGDGKHRLSSGKLNTNIINYINKPTYILDFDIVTFNIVSF